MSKQTAKEILDNLAEEADRIRLYCSGDPRRNSEKVGKLVQDLNEEDRKLLATLLSDDIQDLRPFNKFYWRRTDPIRPLRKRDPAIKIKGSKK